MHKEAVKLLLWPRGEGEINGEKVHKYVVLGIVVTDKPIEWPVESVVMTHALGTPLTDYLDASKKHSLDYVFGDANLALQTLSHLTPYDLEKHATDPEFLKDLGLEKLSH